ncbi:DNA polymerase III subunit alpha [Arcanobacterium pinnipediorum]|uniref:DNA polymerase III subunit alpha n=1 Tax=Arcanobacterium pinnipediorum TaxID=1503041 RepID=A0ABY5AKU9_9ACTO|nr:DNA polymerase III subunit alpha [Arcanobacterium pinnipediorum]USR80041.1 DNA polymerase III subunit alpha [Arcanobacterium pinnipediorum]
MAGKNFAHLHVHTDYSLLDGAAKINKLVAEVARLEQPAVAITDHGYLFGAYEMYKAASAAGIKPIIGLEAYMTPGTSRFDQTRQLWGSPGQRADDVSARGAYTHMTLLSENNTGMHNLFRMNSLASLEGQMGKWPRMDRELLETYHEGLIGTAGCPSGEVQTRLRLGQWDEALKAAGELQDIFGKDNFFIEVMDHGLEIERRVQKDLLKIAKMIDAPLIATNDSHYVKREDRDIQDAMLCINSGSTLMDPDRFKFDGDGYYIKSSEEMWRQFEDLPQAVENTLLIAERCNVSFQTTADGISYMPAFPVPPGEDETSWFINQVEAGLLKRYNGSIPQHVRERADYEVGVITSMGFPGYFLVVSDYIKWAREHGIRVGPGRGSGAGSMVAYALEITQLDPIKHDLLFERFLNPERVSLPDIDVDFDDRRREEVIRYVEQKYGTDKVAQVVTYGTIKTKQALKDAARVLGMPFQMGDQLTKALPPDVQGKSIAVKDIYDPQASRYNEAGEFREFVEANAEARRVYDFALGLEGMTRQTGVHACAVIMSSKSLTDVIPVMKRLQDGAIITQFEYPQCEELGLVKMDFLGLSNLTVIEGALANIRQNGKQAPDIDAIPLDDKETYELLGRAETLGIFQLDSPGMRQLLKQMKPDTFGDISAVSALYRPGPMGANSHTNYALRKNGLQEKTPIHPELATALEDILGTTHGLIVFQEQVMRIAQKLAGFTLGQADILRKAMGKKKADVLQQQFKGFAQGMRDHGYSDHAINTLWEILVPFAQYAFNKSHSEAYALVTYQTAYLKAHYPSEYMAALLTSNQNNKTKVATYLADSRRMGIRVNVPDVNKSMDVYSAVGDEVRVGLSSVRNVGKNVVEGIIKTRHERGEFTSFQDFLDKVPASVLNKRAIECLIKAGAFDSLGYSRRALVAIHDEAIEAVLPVKRNEAGGQFDLFGGLGEDNPIAQSFNVDVPDLPEWDKKEKLNIERDMLGLYVSDHPLSGLEAFLDRAADHTILGIQNDENPVDGHIVTVAGLITTVQTRISQKNGKTWATATIEDFTGSIEVNFFPATYQSVSQFLIPDTVVTIKARMSVRENGVQLNAMDMNVPQLTGMAEDTPLDIQIPERMLTQQMMQKLSDTLAQYPGKAPIRVHVRQMGKTTVVQLHDAYKVNVNPSLLSSLRVLLGKNALMTQ